MKYGGFWSTVVRRPLYFGILQWGLVFTSGLSMYYIGTALAAQLNLGDKFKKYNRVTSRADVYDAIAVRNTREVSDKSSK